MLASAFPNKCARRAPARQNLDGPVESVRGFGHRLDEVRLDFATHAIEHDFSGSIVTGLDLHFEYDPYGRLIAAFDPQDTLVEAFSYTADGRLARHFDEYGRTTAFAHDGDQIIAAFTSDGKPLWESVFGPGIDQLLLWTNHTAQAAYVPLVDHRNSVVATWNTATGAIDEIAQYNPHGRTTLFDVHEDEICREEGHHGVHCVAPSLMPFGFVSGFRSEATGLIFMRNRWYNPRLGQFMSHDPLGFVDSYNLYAYAAFDPINAWDPWGLSESDFQKPRRSFFRRGIGEKLENSPFVQDGFGGEDDPTVHRIGGLAGAIKDTGEAAEDLADSVGDYLHEGMEERDRNLNSRRAQARGPVGQSFYDFLLQMHNMERIFVPESGDEIMLGMALGGRVGRVPSRTTAVHVGHGKSIRTFRETGSGTNLIRSTRIGGKRYEIKSGHGYNRAHRTGDVRNSGLKMDDIDNAILDDLVAFQQAGGALPTPGPGFSGPLQRTISVENTNITYRVIRTADGTVSVGTYFP